MSAQNIGFCSNIYNISKIHIKQLTLISPAHFEDVQSQSGVNHIYEGKNNCVS